MSLPIIKIENERGEVLNLSTDVRYVPMLTGTGPPGATINRTKVATSHGSRFNSASVDERSLVLTVYIVRDIARARMNLYRWLGAGQYIKIYYEADGMNVWTEGYIEHPEVNPWSQDQNIMAPIVCPDPFWRDAGESYTDASMVTSCFEFPFAIPEEGIELSTIDITASAAISNKGHVPTGIRIEIKARVHSLNPRIYNVETGEFIGANIDMEAGDRLIIDTEDGQKGLWLMHKGNRTNVLNNIMAGHTWLQLPVGQTEFAYTVDTGDVELLIYHMNKYQGV